MGLPYSINHVQYSTLTVFLLQVNEKLEASISFLVKFLLPSSNPAVTPMYPSQVNRVSYSAIYRRSQRYARTKAGHTDRIKSETFPAWTDAPRQNLDCELDLKHKSHFDPFHN